MMKQKIKAAYDLFEESTWALRDAKELLDKMEENHVKRPLEQFMSTTLPPPTIFTDLK